MSEVKAKKPMVTDIFVEGATEKAGLLDYLHSLTF